MADSSVSDFLLQLRTRTYERACAQLTQLLQDDEANVLAHQIYDEVREYGIADRAAVIAEASASNRFGDELLEPEHPTIAGEQAFDGRSQLSSLGYEGQRQLHETAAGEQRASIEAKAEKLGSHVRLRYRELATFLVGPVPTVQAPPPNVVKQAVKFALTGLDSFNKSKTQLAKEEQNYALGILVTLGLNAGLSLNARDGDGFFTIAPLPVPASLSNAEKQAAKNPNALAVDPRESLGRERAAFRALVAEVQEIVGSGITRWDSNAELFDARSLGSLLESFNLNSPGVSQDRGLDR